MNIRRLSVCLVSAVIALVFFPGPIEGVRAGPLNGCVALGSTGQDGMVDTGGDGELYVGLQVPNPNGGALLATGVGFYPDKCSQAIEACFEDGDLFASPEPPIAGGGVDPDRVVGLVRCIVQAIV